MSSACVCHTNEWCFYCNMYTPLERKYESQKESIERVIVELEERMADYDHRYADKRHPNREYFDGRGDGVYEAIEKLKEVLEDAASNPNSADGHGTDHLGDDKADQVVSSE